MQPLLKATRSAASVHPSAEILLREDKYREDEEEEAGPLGRCPELNENVSMLADAARKAKESKDASFDPVFHNESKPVDFELRSQENQQLISRGKSEAGLHMLIANTK